MKTVFVGHPIAGDIQENIKRVLQICQEIHTTEIIPVVPYLVSLQYLDDTVVEDRQLGMEANHECFRRRYVDELWLYGDKISSGMQREIVLARELGILVIAKTKETKKELKKMLVKTSVK